jgi:hypothetical protein
MTGLLAGVGRVEPCEELTEQFAELLLSIGGQMRPDGWRVVRRW